MILKLTHPFPVFKDGANSVLALDLDEYDVSVHDNWGNAPGLAVGVDGKSMTRENKLQKWARSVGRSDMTE